MDESGRKWTQKKPHLSDLIVSFGAEGRTAH